MNGLKTVDQRVLGGIQTDTARRRRTAFWTCFVALLVLFAKPFANLVGFAWDSSLYSHTPLIPVIAVYLLWTSRSSAPQPSRPARVLPFLFTIAAAVLLGTYFMTGPYTTETSLAFTMTAFVLLLGASVGWFLGGAVLRFAAFPLSFLFFMVPLPTEWMPAIEAFLQHGSAAVAWALFQISGTAVFYTNLVFQLPGISLRVAPECSGIHSTLALLIVSVLAGHWFLPSRWRAAVLSLSVVPLALLRNGFRIFTIGELCVYRGPQMIDSPIHHQGGPLFFAASLVPFLAFLWLLRRGEQRTNHKPV